MGLQGNSDKISLSDYIQRGVYAIVRKCPNVHNAFGYESIWDISGNQFKWIIENLSKEFEVKDKNATGKNV